MWLGEKLARQPSDQDQLSSPRRHLYLAVSRALSGKGPFKLKPQKKPLEWSMTE